MNALRHEMEPNGLLAEHRLATHTFGAAIYYAACKVDAMFEALEGVYWQRDLFLLYIQNQTFFEPYRADPRYPACVKQGVTS